jgi:hypothetical protein
VKNGRGCGFRISIFSNFPSLGSTQLRRQLAFLVYRKLEAELDSSAGVWVELPGPNIVETHQSKIERTLHELTRHTNIKITQRTKEAARHLKKEKSTFHTLPVACGNSTSHCIGKKRGEQAKRKISTKGSLESVFDGL